MFDDGALCLLLMGLMHSHKKQQPGMVYFRWTKSVYIEKRCPQKLSHVARPIDEEGNLHLAHVDDIRDSAALAFRIY